MRKASRNCRPNSAVRQWRGSRPALAALLLLIGSVAATSCRQDEVRANSAPPPIEIRASVQPSQAVTITTQIDGQIETLGVREGAPIAEGALVAQLSNPAVERDAAAAAAQSAWLDARLRRSGRPAATPRAAPSNTLDITARILEVRRQRFEKMKDLRRTRDITARELEQAEVEYLAALRDYNNERRVFAVAPAGASDDPELLRIEGAKASAEQKFAIHRQSLLQIQSPIAGVVTRVHATQGQNVFPRDPIAEVANVSTLHVRGSVAPELLRYVRPGMKVDVKVLTVPVRTFADEIDYVVAVQGGQDSRAATVIVSIPNPDGSLQPNTEALITVRSLR